MTRHGLGLAVAVVVGAMGFGASDANAEHYRHGGYRGHGGYARCAPSYYRPVYAAPYYAAPYYAAPVVYAPPVTYVEPYYRPVTYVSRPVYYPPVVRPYYGSVAHYGYAGHHRAYGGYVGSGGAGFSYGSRHRSFSVGVGY